MTHKISLWHLHVALAIISWSTPTSSSLMRLMATTSPVCTSKALLFQIRAYPWNPFSLSLFFISQIIPVHSSKLSLANAVAKLLKNMSMAILLNPNQENNAYIAWYHITVFILHCDLDLLFVVLVVICHGISALTLFEYFMASVLSMLVDMSSCTCAFKTRSWYSEQGIYRSIVLYTITLHDMFHVLNVCALMFLMTALILLTVKEGSFLIITMLTPLCQRAVATVHSRWSLIYWFLIQACFVIARVIQWCNW